MDLRTIYKYLDLKAFDRDEFDAVFDKIVQSQQQQQQQHYAVHDENDDTDDTDHAAANDAHGADIPTTTTTSTTADTDTATISTTKLTQRHLRDFVIQRITQLEEENGCLPKTTTTRPPTSSSSSSNSSSTSYEHSSDDKSIQLRRRRRSDYANQEASRMLQTLFAQQYTTTASMVDNDKNDDTQQHANQDYSMMIDKSTFSSTLVNTTSAVDMPKLVPITISMLLVGSSVGIITPIMPFVVQELGLSPGQYGMVISAFAIAKMVCNVPSAILVETHGRKPYLVYSLSVIALGVGGIGLATQFEHLWICRLLTGAGVAALSTAATLSISDISTPRNRASTMAPIMSAFAAGTALGPALGGFLADSIGVNTTFYLVGGSFLGLTVVNHLLLTETKANVMTFPWQDDSVLADRRDKQSIGQAVKDAVGQWGPLMADPRVRNVVIMNGFYWIALAGSQMTLLPLLLTDPSGLAMTATGVGQVYMGMSAIQVFGNPILAKFVDRVGKTPAIVAGSSLIALSMGLLPMCTDMYQLAGTLGVWATGSTVLSTAPVAYISDTVGDDKRAQAIALLRTGGDVGFLIGAASMGALADWTGLDGAMQTSAGVLLTATGWFATRQMLNAKANKTR